MADKKEKAPFTIHISCPTCGGPLGLVNALVHAGGTLSLAILECPACEREWEVTARMVPHGPSRAAVARADEAKKRKSARRELVPA